MLERVINELQTRFLKEGDYLEITMKRTGKKLYIYRQRYGIAIYDNPGNIWVKNRPGKFFPNAKNALRGAAEYIIKMA